MRTSELVSSGPYWQLVMPVLKAGERPIHMAHLRCVQGAQDYVGTLFVTTHQVVWRAVDPRIPEGHSFEIRFPEITAVEQPSRLSVFHAFRVVTEEDGRAVDTYFFPQQRTEVERLLCDRMFVQVDEAFRHRRNELHLSATA